MAIFERARAGITVVAQQSDLAKQVGASQPSRKGCSCLEQFGWGSQSIGSSAVRARVVDLALAVAKGHCASGQQPQQQSQQPLLVASLFRKSRELLANVSIPLSRPCCENVAPGFHAAVPDACFWPGGQRVVTGAAEATDDISATAPAFGLRHDAAPTCAPMLKSCRWTVACAQLLLCRCAGHLLENMLR